MHLAQQCSSKMKSEAWSVLPDLHLSDHRWRRVAVEFAPLVPGSSACEKTQIPRSHQCHHSSIQIVIGSRNADFLSLPSYAIPEYLEICQVDPVAVPIHDARI